MNNVLVVHWPDTVIISSEVSCLKAFTRSFGPSKLLYTYFVSLDFASPTVWEERIEKTTV